MHSPEYVKTSLAAAMTLGLKDGSFFRDAHLRALNLLLTYSEGCAANCAYCGLSRSRRQEDTFIRVAWPVYAVEEIVRRSLPLRDQLQRVCVSMVTHPRALADLCTIIAVVRGRTPFPVSALVTPTGLDAKQSFAQIRAAGADKVGIAVDASSQPLFELYRGAGVGGPHRWPDYWAAVEEAVRVFGRTNVGIHLIVGLGESEYEAVATIQKAHSLGAATHLFSFFPEKGTSLDGRGQPPLGGYRRVQLARYLINGGLSALERMAFNSAGQVVGFGNDGLDLDKIIAGGEPFRTSGCTGADGEVACNRPYGNERPSQPLRNFPFAPEPEDIKDIRAQIIQY